jgi:hypothetical protein
MDKIEVFQKDKDGFTSISDLSWKNITIPTKNIFPLIRSTQPNELELLLYEKTKNNFTHVDGCVIKLVHAPKLLYPYVDKLTNQNTLDDSEPQDMFSKFRRQNFIIPDPPSDYLYKFKENYDNKLLAAFSDIKPIKNYVEMYRKNKKNTDSKEGFKKIRKRLYDDLWLDSKIMTRREASRMHEQILNIERKYYGYGVPLVPVCTEEPEYIEKAKQTNEASQAIADPIDIQCATNFVFTKNAIKSTEITSRYFDYIRDNKWATLNIIKNIGFDMHDLDMEARQRYFEFMSEIAEIQEERPKKIFMLLEGGHQGYLSMQVFDIVSHSLTGVDEDDTGFGTYSVGNWYDHKLMVTRPPHLAFNCVDKNHCSVCQTITKKDFFDPILRIKRRKHMLYDFDKRASGICDAVKTKTVKRHMMHVLGNSEFAGFKEYLLNQ